MMRAAAIALRAGDDRCGKCMITKRCSAIAMVPTVTLSC